MTFGEVKYGDRFADLDKRIWVKTSLVSVGLFGNFNAMRPCCSGREPNWHKFNDEDPVFTISVEDEKIQDVLLELEKRMKECQASSKPDNYSYYIGIARGYEYSHDLLKEELLAFE